VTDGASLATVGVRTVSATVHHVVDDVTELDERRMMESAAADGWNAGSQWYDGVKTTQRDRRRGHVAWASSDVDEPTSLEDRNKVDDCQAHPGPSIVTCNKRL